MMNDDQDPRLDGETTESEPTEATETTESLETATAPQEENPELADDLEVSEEEIQRIMAQYDKESNTRAYQGLPKTVMRWLCVAFTVYVLIINIFYFFSPQQMRASFLALIILFAFLLYPAKKNLASRVNYVPWYDVVLAVLGVSCFMYYVFSYETIALQQGAFTEMNMWVGIVGILILFECCRRVVGIPLMVVVGLFLCYAFFGQYIPGSFGHAGRTPLRIITFLFYSLDGVIGTPIGVCTTFIFIFILFGAFLEKTGIGAFFIDLANSIAGRAVGGPAKVAVISSALQGTISGSSVANTVGTGSFTIPMMKRMGYKPHFAGAVEATASTGGQLMPPIMGAAAFLMAEITGIPYRTIILAAVVPAILYFSSVLLAVHFEAKKLGLKGLPAAEIPHLGRLLKEKGQLLLAIVAIVVFLALGFTTSRAAMYAIVVAIIVSSFRKDTRLTRKTFVDALENGARNSIGVGVACGMAGMIVGVVTMTGLGMTFANALQKMAAGINDPTLSLLAALFFCMIASILLGMGVPTTANYVIMATVTAPIVVRMGVPMLAAHMFVFYFGIIADITPPVALAAFAGSAIARSDPMRTGLTASRLGIAAFIVPYVFVLNPVMLFIDATPLTMIQVILSAFLGIVGIASSLSGYLAGTMRWYERVLAFVAGLSLIIPETTTDVIGLVVIGGIFLLERHRNKKTPEDGALKAA